MKHFTTISSVIAILLASSTLHALPENWEVDLAAKPPQVFTLQRPRGETYEIEAVLKKSGKPFEPAITNACIYWQTNGMENLYWSAPASVSNNVLRATWLPSMDPGAATVRGYIGDPGHIYAAAFQFRFIASPGATPNELPLPQKVIDFSKVTVLNPPWSGGGGGGGVDTNAVIDIVHETVEPMIEESIAANEMTGTDQQIVRASLESGQWDMCVTDAGLANEAMYAWRAEEDENNNNIVETYATKDELEDAVSTNNPAFVSAVRSVSPPSSPFLRVFDDVRQCWWIGRMVNGVINWEVE